MIQAVMKLFRKRPKSPPPVRITSLELYCQFFREHQAQGGALISGQGARARRIQEAQIDAARQFAGRDYCPGCRALAKRALPEMADSPAIPAAYSESGEDCQKSQPVLALEVA